MVAGQPERLVELAIPGGGALAGAGIDQIEREAGKAVAGVPDRGDRLGAVVSPAEKMERRRVERLDPERQPVDPGRGKGAEARASEELGLASRVISTSRPTRQRLRSRSSRAPTVSGGIREGVPPPKNTEATSRPGISSA